MKKIGVIVVNYQSLTYLKSCLNQLFKQKTKCKLFAVVIDNSPHGEIRNLKKKYSKEVAFLFPETNLGFSKAVNKGIRLALFQKATHVLLINPDVAYPKNLLEVLSKTRADIVAPLLKFTRNKRTYFDFGGKINWTWGRTDHWENAKILETKKFSPDYFSGCCLLIKKEVLEKIGFFDERFFMYFEDVDFCLRAKKAGFKLQQNTSVVLTHFLKQEREKSLFAKYQLLRSNLLFILKYQKSWRLLLSLLYWKLLVIKTVLNQLLDY